MDYQKFNKIPRLSRDITITEKLDGTNAQIFIYNSNEELRFPFVEHQDIPSNEFIDKYLIAEKNGLYMFVGSRNRWLDTSSDGDNNGFAKWAKQNSSELFKLGEGRHYGEWVGKKIQRGYNLDEKRFYLFNCNKWVKLEEGSFLMNIKYSECPKCCYVVPILYEGKFDTNEIDLVLHILKTEGSKAVPGYMNPEGIIIYHSASGRMFKKTILNDEKPKGINEK